MGNPNHDPKTGEFSEGPGGTMGSAAHASGASTGDKTSNDAISGHSALVTSARFQGRSSVQLSGGKLEARQLGGEKIKLSGAGYMGRIQFRYNNKIISSNAAFNLLKNK